MDDLNPEGTALFFLTVIHDYFVALSCLDHIKCIKHLILSKQKKVNKIILYYFVLYNFSLGYS